MMAAALLGSAAILFAQGNAPQHDGPPGTRGPGRPDGPGMGGHRPPPPPIIAALDANHDGVIDADEIKNAGNALKTLDKNGDGKLTPDELHPPRAGGPDMGGPEMGSPGPEGFGGPEFDGPPPRR